MKRIIKFTEFLNEEIDGNGGVAFATGNANGMGNVLAPTVGSSPGSVSQAGSGQIGSGDSAAYDMGKKFGQYINKDKKEKKAKKQKKQKPFVFTKQSLPW